MKRTARALALGAFSLLAGVSHAAIKGDVNLDGQVDSADYALLNQALGGSYTLAWNQRDAADVAPIGTNDLIGDGAVTSADALVFDQALQGNDVDGDGLNVAAETGGSAATNGSPFLRDTDRDGAPDDVDSTRGGFNANSPPSAPTVAITGTTGTSLIGTASACSNPDGLPYPSACTQEVRIVAAGGSCDAAPIVAPVAPSSGAWTVNGLAEGVVYSAYVRSSDGELVACSAAQTRATTPTGTAAVVPYLDPLASTTATNPINASGFGTPGQQIRVFVNGIEQDFVRSFATGNPAIPTNPFVVPASGAFSVPVVLDDGINRVRVAAISSGSVESAPSNESSTKYENLIPRGTPNPLRILPAPTPNDPNSEEISAGQIFVLTKGDMPGFTAEYYLDHHLEAKADALLVIGVGAQLRFVTPTAQSLWKRKIAVGGTLRARGTVTNRAVAYTTSLTNLTLGQWDGIEIQSTSRGSSLSGIAIRNTTKAITVVGTIASRPDFELHDSALDWYMTTGVDISQGGQISVSGNEFSLSNLTSTAACSRDALIATSSTGITISKNLLNGARYGFTVVDTPAVIEENVFDPGLCQQNPPNSFGAAIRVVGSVGSTTVRRNTISQFLFDGSQSSPKWRSGILIENSSPTVEDNAIFDAICGVEVLTSGGGSASPLIQRNTFDRIANYTTTGGWGNDPNPDKIHGAVVLRDGAGGTVRENRISNLWNVNYGRGVFVRNAGTAAIEISDNEILRMLVGIHVHNAAIPVGENIVARENSIGNSSATGIYLTHSDATLEDNVIRGGTSGGSDWIAGIYLFETTALVQRNTVREMKYGVKATGGHPEILSNHFAGNTRAGVLVEATEAGTLIRGNRIEEHRVSSGGQYGTGIIVRHSGTSAAGTLVTIDAGNIITGNLIGIRIEGLANSAVGQPVPIITGNSIYDNAYLTTLQNIQIVSYSTPAQTALDLSDNWWNTTNQTEINARILYLSPPGSGFQPIADIDFANVVTAPNTSFFVGALNATVGGVSTRNVYFEPNPGAPTPPVASIGFKVYDPGASVVVRICPELAPLCNAGTAVFSSAPQTFSAGAASLNWNGTDASGKAVAPEAYAYQLEATKGAVTQTIDSLIRDAFALGTLVTPPGVPTTYDGYRNEPVKVKYGNTGTPTSTGSGPMRVVFDVQPRDSAGRLIANERFVTGPENYPDGQPIPATPGSAKIPYLVWPSRSSDGKVISGSTAIEIRPAPLKYYVIVVAGSAPIVTRDTGALNLVAEPRLVYDTFEQVAAIRYKVDRLADVVISLLPPSSWDDTGAPTWRFLNVPANTNQLFEFRGHEVLGMDGVIADSAQQLVTALAQEGAFTFRVRATDKVSSRTAETLVTVQVRH